MSVVEHFKAMPLEEFKRSTVRLGITTEGGKLTKKYQPPPTPKRKKTRRKRKAV